MTPEEIFHEPCQNVRWASRTLCSVLEDMRAILKHNPNPILSSLLEEAQVYGNRMEAKLSDVSSYGTMKEKYKKMKEEVDAYENTPPKAADEMDDLI